jgi:hypothetical protein
MEVANAGDTVETPSVSKWHAQLLLEGGQRDINYCYSRSRQQRGKRGSN